MNEQLTALLRELEEFGAENDARTTDRAHRMMNITHDTGEFLRLLIRALGARRVLEIGTSNGYSTLWLAEAVQPLHGKVITLEILPHKTEMAQANFARANLKGRIEQHLGDAGEFLLQQTANAFDFIFLDSERKAYQAWWHNLQRVLRPGGVIVADNAVSHVQEMSDFVKLVQGTPGYITSVVPVGNGEFVVLKEPEL